jgi:hypothetical protein
MGCRGQLEVGGGSAGDGSSLSSTGYAGQSWQDTSTGAVTVGDITNCSDTSTCAGTGAGTFGGVTNCSDGVTGTVSVTAAGGGATTALSGAAAALPLLGVVVTGNAVAVLPLKGVVVTGCTAVVALVSWHNGGLALATVM